MRQSDVVDARRPWALAWSARLRRAFGVVLVASGLCGCDACSRSGQRVTSGTDAGAAPGLSAERARLVLARVGERSITLGDYAAALERMDPFERMRYQTEDRRQALLDEMINVELWAREAARRGLDRRPEIVELVRQYQRDELLRRLRTSLPGPADLSAAEVSRFYQEHRQDFFEPERRRAAQIVLDDESLARRVLGEALGSSPERWAELVARYAPSTAVAAGDKTRARPPLEVPGDVGFLSRAPDPAGGGVPEPVRAAVFEIPAVGQVHSRLIPHAARFHVVRLVSKLEARQGSLAEVDAMIRARLVQKLQAEAETALLQRLRQATAVSIDDAALERVPAPTPAAAASSITKAAPAPP
jgi:hypothetical protein